MEVSLSYADSLDLSHSLSFSNLQSPSAFPSFLSEGSQLEYSESHGCGLDDDGTDELEDECECITEASEEYPVTRTDSHGSSENEVLYEQCLYGSGRVLQEKIIEAPFPGHDLANSETQNHDSECPIDNDDDDQSQAYNDNDDDDQTQAYNDNDDDDETIDGNFPEDSINRDREDDAQSRASFGDIRSQPYENLSGGKFNLTDHRGDNLLYLQQHKTCNDMEGDKDSHVYGIQNRLSVDLHKEYTSCMDGIPFQNASSDSDKDRHVNGIQNRLSVDLHKEYTSCMDGISFQNASSDGDQMDSCARSPKSNTSVFQGVSIRALKELLINLPKEIGSLKQGFANKLPSSDTLMEANSLAFQNLVAEEKQKQKHVVSVNTFISGIGSGESEDKENNVHCQDDDARTDKPHSKEVFKLRESYSGTSSTSIHVLKESVKRNIAPVNVNLVKPSNSFKAVKKMVASEYTSENFKAEPVCDDFETTKKGKAANVKSEPICNDSETVNNIALGFSAVKVKLEPIFLSEHGAELNPVLTKSEMLSSGTIIRSEDGNGGLGSNLVDVKTELFFGDTDFDVITSDKGSGKSNDVVTSFETVKIPASSVQRLLNNDSRKRFAATEAFQLQESRKKFIGIAAASVKTQIEYTGKKEPDGIVLAQPKGWMCPKQSKKNFKCKPKQVLIDNWLVKQR